MEHDNFEDILVSSLESLKETLLEQHRRCVRKLEADGFDVGEMGAFRADEPAKSLNPKRKQASRGVPRNVESAVMKISSLRTDATSISGPPLLTTPPSTEAHKIHKSTTSWHTLARGPTRHSWCFSACKSNRYTDPTTILRGVDPEKFLLNMMVHGQPPQMVQTDIDFAAVTEEDLETDFPSRALNMLGHIVDMFMNLIVVANICVMSINTDICPRWRGWFVLDAIFATIYVLEVIFKLCYYGVSTYFLGPQRRWHTIEASLAMFAVIEVALNAVVTQQDQDTSKVTFLRIIRLFRSVKIVRMMRMEIFAELAQMIDGALGGVRTLLWSMVLLVIPVYMVAIIFRDSLGQYASENRGAELFDSFPGSFFTMSRCVVTGDCSTDGGRPIFVLVTKNYGWIYGAFYLLFMVFCIFGIFNVIVSIFVEKAVEASKYNALVKKRNRLQCNMMLANKTREMCLVILRVAGVRSSRKRPEALASNDMQAVARSATGLVITSGMWARLRRDSEFNNCLFDLDISEEDQDDLFSTVDADGGGTIQVVELIVAICMLRGDAKRSDIVSVNLMAHHIHSVVCEAKEETAQILDKHDKTLQSMLGMIRNASYYRQIGPKTLLL